MKIVRHTARDMRQAMRAVREQLGEDAVILASRRTAAGVEVTAAVDFEAATLEAGGFVAALGTAEAPPLSLAVDCSPAGTPVSPAPTANAVALASTLSPAHALSTANAPITTETVTPVGTPSVPQNTPALAPDAPSRQVANDAEWISLAAREAVMAYAEEVAAAANMPSEAAVSAAKWQVITEARARTATFAPGPASRSSVASSRTAATVTQPALTAVTDEPVSSVIHGEPDPAILQPADEPMYSAAAPTLAAATETDTGAAIRMARTRIDVNFDTLDAAPDQALPTDVPTISPTTAASEAMNNELRTLRQMLEAQLAHLAWNDMARRAPVRVEMLRELAEMGITRDLAEHLVRQVPEDQDLTFARRFAIAGLSQYLRTTGDRWLDAGGRVAFIGATGVGKTTTIAKIAVRWVLRHGPRNVALVAGDSVRIGAQEQLRALAQMLGVPVYAPDKFEELPALLQRLTERLVLVDTPGASSRDPQLRSRLAQLQSVPELETAVVLAASTQTGAIEECVHHFAAARPACCVLTKLDEAASLGGLLSALIQARLPVAYTSEGQRVPEDLRPARALELVSAAVRLAKDSGAAADEDLLRRRFGKTAHGFA